MESYRLWFLFRCLPAIIGAVMAGLLLSISPARAQEMLESESSYPSLGPSGVEAGLMLFRDAITGQYTPALVQSGKVHFAISGMVAVVTLEQSFRNTSDQWVEGTYAFPLPDQAAVRHMEMMIGERRIVGKIKEKSIAKEIYKAAKKAGKKASLVEQQRPNLFTNQVANIGPGEEITVRLEYVQKVEYINDEFSLRFPMTITPRYRPDHGVAGVRRALKEDEEQGEESGEVESEMESDQEVQPLLGWVLPAGHMLDTPDLNRIEITARLDVGMPLANIEATYHEIVLSRSKGLYELSLASVDSSMDRDFVLRWRPVIGSEPTAAVFTEQVGDDYYGLLMLVPPKLTGPSDEIILPREMIFVIDTSGSMGGQSIEQARKSLIMALAQLRPQDSFNIIEFNSRHRALFKTSMPATGHSLQIAGEFVRLLSANGGTEMLPALRTALSGSYAEESENTKVRQVIFITDGAIGNEAQLFEEIQRTLGNSRLFTVGIGSAPNSWFMRKAAQFGRGTHIHIGDTAEVAEKMQRLFELISTPLAVNVKIKWPLLVEAYPQRVPDVYKGEPVMVAFKLTARPVDGEILVSGDMAKKSWSRRVRFEVPQANIENPSINSGVASIWAREKIAALLDEKLMGRDEEQIRLEVLDVALTHSLMSPYTSFVAVEERISRPRQSGLRKVAIPNARPKGLAAQSFGYPMGATTGPANFFLGAFSLFLAMMTFVMRRPEVDGDE